MWEMPLELHRQLSTSYLVLSKGDANYRRLLGDRHWDFTTPFAQAVGSVPAPLLALRTITVLFALASIALIYRLGSVLVNQI